jgi:hypothetical protein
MDRLEEFMRQLWINHASRKVPTTRRLAEGALTQAADNEHARFPLSCEVMIYLATTRPMLHRLRATRMDPRLGMSCTASCILAVL